MTMRKSRVLRKLRAGGIVSCFALNLGSERVAEIASMHGFDCLWLKMEHTSSDLSVIEAQIKSAKLYDTDTLVRVPRGSYSSYIRPLELDATEIMVPHVMGVEDAERVVGMTRFHPVGRRPLDGGNADGKFCNIPIKEYIQEANRERFVMLQIEDFEALADLDQICALDGVDIIFFGALDYSHSLGIPGEMSAGRVEEVRRRIAECANAHGKFAGATAPLHDLDRLIDMGYRFLAVGGDVSAMNRFCTEAISTFAQTEVQRAPAADSKETGS